VHCYLELDCSATFIIRMFGILGVDNDSKSFLKILKNDCK